MRPIRSRTAFWLFAALFVLGTVSTVALPYRAPFHFLSAFLYVTFTLLWALSIRRRITKSRIRRRLLFSAALLVLFFCLRIESGAIPGYVLPVFWPLYFVCTTLIPLLSLECAATVGKEENAPVPKGVRALFLPWAVLLAAILTNPLHSLCLDFTPGGRLYGPVYVAAISWEVALGLAAFGVLLRRTRLSACRRLWFVPVVPMVLCAALFLWYVLSGGAPTLGGVKLYNYQEVYLLLFVGCWESSIQIGLLPSNSGYFEIFNRSSVGALIADKAGEVRFRSVNAPALTKEQMDEVKAGKDVSLADARLGSKEIRGGTVFFVEDVSSIRRLNARLEDAVERIEEENTLIEEENGIRERRSAIETQTKLFDSIALATRRQLDELDRLLGEPCADEADFRARLERAAALGAYVKRRANLTLIADSAPEMRVAELVLSVKELLAYRPDLTGDVSAAADFTVPSGRAMEAYDFIEEILEAVAGKASAVLIFLSDAGGLRLRAEADCPPPDGFGGFAEAENGAVFFTRVFGEEAAI